MNKLNYFLSGWIANLGVVPLFSFAFFLFDPAFFAFILLLALVCVVFDAILLSSNYLFNKIFRETFLSLSSLLVKTFVISVCLSSVSLAKNIESDLFISKGEQIELKVGKIRNFSVGNKEVVKYVYRAKRGVILIKGKSLGLSDVMVWSNKNKKQVYRVYVLSKKEQLGRAGLAEALKKNGLNTRLQGNTIYATGEIKSVQAYKTVIQSQSNKGLNIVYDLSLSNKVRNLIISEIYRGLYWQGADKVDCNLISITFFCKVYGKVNTQIFEKKYNIHFIKNDYQINFNNYKIDFSFISLENNQGSNSSLGFDRIESQLLSTIQENRLLLETGNIFFQDNILTAKTISKPIIHTILNKGFSLQIGGELPFTKTVDKKETTEWKFSGLKLTGKIVENGGKILLNYKSEMTTPIRGSITGPKGRSSIYLQEGKLYQLFSIDLQNDMIEKSLIPLLSSIPILKHLFMTNKNSHITKKIICYAKLTRE